MMKKVAILFSILIMFACIFPQPVEAKKQIRYFAAIMIDDNADKVTFEVIRETESVSSICHYVNPDITCSLSDTNQISPKHTKGVTESSNLADGRSYLELIFPGSIIDPSSSDGDSKQLSSVVGALVDSANSIIDYVRVYGNAAGKSASTYDILKSIQGIKNGSNFYGISVKGVTDERQIRSIEKAAARKNSWTYMDSISNWGILSSGSGNPEVLVRLKASKGYRNGNMHNANYYSLSGRYFFYDLVIGSEDGTDNLSVGDIAYWSCLAKDNGITANDPGVSAFQKQGTIEKQFNNMIGNIVTGLGAGVLGISTLEELVFNRGTRATSYYLGMMNISWYRASSILFWAAEIIAIFILFASVLKMLSKRSLAIISPAERITLRDGILNTLLAIVLIAFYPILFYIMAKLNYLIVTSLDELTEGAHFANISNGKLIIFQLVVAIIQLFITAKLNIDYLVRSVTLIALHVMAPVAISSIAFNGRKGFFETWLKELIVGIFMQSFNAIVLSIILIVTSASQPNWFEAVVFTYMFIPLNKWFKDNLMGFRGSGSDAVGDQTSKSVRNAGGVAMGAAFMGAKTFAEIRSGKKESNYAHRKAKGTGDHGGGRTETDTTTERSTTTTTETNSENTPTASGNFLSKAKQVVSKAGKALNDGAAKVVGGQDNLNKIKDVGKDLVLSAGVGALSAMDKPFANQIADVWKNSNGRGASISDLYDSYKRENDKFVQETNDHYDEQKKNLDNYQESMGKYTKGDYMRLNDNSSYLNDYYNWQHKGEKNVPKFNELSTQQRMELMQSVDQDENSRMQFEMEQPKYLDQYQTQHDHFNNKFKDIAEMNEEGKVTPLTRDQYRASQAIKKNRDTNTISFNEFESFTKN